MRYCKECEDTETCRFWGGCEHSLGNSATENQMNMNKWIGIYGNANSGIKSREDAIAWCANQLGSTKPGAGTKAFLCEVVEQVRLTTPTHETVPYTADMILPKTGNGVQSHADF